MHYISPLLTAILTVLTLTAWLGRVYNAESASLNELHDRADTRVLNSASLAIPNQCGSPTPAPTPALQPRTDEIVSVMSTPALTGAPGDTLTLRGSLTNTTDQVFTLIGFGFTTAEPDNCEGNSPGCPILNLGPSRLSTDPLPAHHTTGDVPITDIQLNPGYTGPLPRVIDFTFFVSRQGAFSGITTFSLRIQPRQDASRPPLLLSDLCTQRAVAIDSSTFTAEPFGLTNPSNFSSDLKTRVMLFAWNMNLGPDEGVSAVTVEAVDSQQAVHPLPVEFVGDVPNEDGLTQIIVRLPDDLPLGADVRLRVKAHGFTSNEAPLAIKPGG